MSIKAKGKHEGKDIDFDMSEDEFVELAKSNPTLLDKIKSLIKPPKKESTKTKETGNETMEMEKLAELIADTVEKKLQPITDDMAKVKEGYEKYNQTLEQEQKAIQSKQVDDLLAKASKEGRIAEGEIQTWKEKYENQYAGNFDTLKEVVELRQPDEKLIKGNAAKGGKPNESQYTPGSEGGTPSYKNEDIAKMTDEQYEKEREQIFKADTSNTIID